MTHNRRKEMLFKAAEIDKLRERYGLPSRNYAVADVIAQYLDIDVDLVTIETHRDTLFGDTYIATVPVYAMPPQYTTPTGK